MSKRIGPRIYSVLLVLGLISIPLLNAQQSAPEAPVPSQIATAKKVFVSHGDTYSPVRGEGELFSGGPDRAYNQFYSAIKSWERYELVPAPSDADLVFEISFGLLNGFEMKIKDPRTHTLLWSFSERIYPYGRKRTRDKNYDAGLNYIVDDLKYLVGRAGEGAAAK